VPMEPAAISSETVDREELVQAADLVLTNLRELSPAAIEGLGSGS
jgi:hypothetical protein